MNQAFLLDTSARDQEPGTDRVVAILREYKAGHCRCYACFMSLMEVYGHLTTYQFYT